MATAPPPILRPVAPVGERAAVGFVTRSSGCGLARWVVPVYPARARTAGEELRAARIAAPYLTLADAARRVGLRASEVSGLETGRLAFATAADRVAFLAALKEGR